MARAGSGNGRMERTVFLSPRRRQELAKSTFRQFPVDVLSKTHLRPKRSRFADHSFLPTFHSE
jgi:hypothetical protein